MTSCSNSPSPDFEDPEALWSEVEHLPMLSDLNTHARLRWLDYAGLQREELEEIFNQVELDIRACMAQKSIEYEMISGADLSRSAFGPQEPVPTSLGYALISFSDAQAVLFGGLASQQGDQARRAADDSFYAEALYGAVISDLKGGCSGVASQRLGGVAADEAMEASVEYLVGTIAAEPRFASALAEHESCLGASRSQLLSEVRASLEETVDVRAARDAQLEIALTDLACGEKYLRPLDTEVDAALMDLMNEPLVAAFACQFSAEIAYDISSSAMAEAGC